MGSEPGDYRWLFYFVSCVCMGMYFITPRAHTQKKYSYISCPFELLGSKEERDVLEKVSQFSSRADKLAAFYASDHTYDVAFSYNGTVAKNGDISMVVRAKNESRETRHVKVNMYGKARYYNGVVGDELAEFHDDVTLYPGACK